MALLAENDAFEDDLDRVARHVGDASLDFALHTVLAHHRLTSRHLAFRRQKVDAEFGAYFGTNVYDEPIEADQRLARSLLMLVPDAHLTDVARTYCGAIVKRAAQRNPPLDKKSLLHKRLTAYAPLAAAAAAAKLPEGTSAVVLDATLTLQELDELRKVCEAVSKALLQQAKWVRQTLVPMCEALHSERPFRPWDRSRVVVRQLQTPSFYTAKDEMAILKHLMGHTFNAASMTGLALDATFKALTEGVDMGRCTDAALKVVRSRRSTAWTELDEAMLDRCATRRPDLDNAVESPGHPADADESDPAWAWPIDKLAQWIEGPIASKEAKPIDNAALARKLPKRKPGVSDTVKSPNASSKKALPEPADDQDAAAERQVVSVVQQALRSSATFFRDDARDMLERLKAYNNLKGKLGELAKVLDELDTLLATPHPWNPAQARTLFAHAEAADENARKLLKTSKSSEKVRKEFMNKLLAALEKEKLSLGKRTGGKIDCPVMAADWAYVNTTVHNRWLHEHKEILVNGKSVFLDADQALALYVTGSSNSGAAFCVSIHLWRRKADCVGTPVADPEESLIMDKSCWFDTYVPCCVLHVPTKGV
ncbi:MAG: hypothetical protein KJ901_12990 [Gammaproteobacteria bacterium]|nr:hypothetical protein [Gammaproteobacteria bacterium]